MKDFYLSELACRQLEEWGCNVPSKIAWFHNSPMTIKTAKKKQRSFVKTYGNDYKKKGHKIIPAYHILEDICCTYARKFFTYERLYRPEIWGDSDVCCMSCPEAIMYYMMDGEKELAEKHLLRNTVFNPANK